MHAGHISSAEVCSRLVLSTLELNNFPADAAARNFSGSVRISELLASLVFQACVCVLTGGFSLDRRSPASNQYIVLHSRGVNTPA